MMRTLLLLAMAAVSVAAQSAPRRDPPMPIPESG